MTPGRDTLLQSHVCLQIPWSKNQIACRTSKTEERLGTGLQADGVWRWT